VQPPLQRAASSGRSAGGTGEGEAGAATFQCHGDTGLRNLASWFTNGWAADAASAFASCGHAANQGCAAVGQKRPTALQKKFGSRTDGKPRTR
jgi:hypothetical protein